MSVTFDVFRGSKEGQIVADQTTRTLGYNEVYIETTHSGLCGTDEHFLKSGQVLGHEGVGVVRQLGRDVTEVKVGDRVGFGYTHYVCGTCDKCLSGWDQYCENKKEYGTHDHDLGSFGHGVVWDARCVVPIPDGYDAADAAPLMCAGATVWTCLTEYGVRPTDRVGVMGIGGLGHLAIKLASAMGCHVVVFSSSEAKREEAFGFGASEYHVFRAGQELSDFKPVNHLLLCGSANVDYTSLIPLMDVHGSIYPLTVDFAPSPVPLLFMNIKGIRIQGSLVASRRSLRTLVQFAADKKITPTKMTFPLTKEGVEKAMQTLRDGKMRYRGVLVRQ
ncbi:Polyketide synthase enoylreductase [Penicillium argentinense]|uniref:Polyketide synthase enoylreductase n=1 Tax=Penicillium argentinense TaxID=1131581 RepID=A0A9W9FN04_9EURO|nr:Polyketide synthase enoylreductase [Penicillium argentinense]KAJ5103221.1 Polyketide synthase enoylreductase [Penicillium argentinense]